MIVTWLRWVAAKAEAVKAEAELMKDVPGWKVKTSSASEALQAGASVYSEGCKWVPPATQKNL